MPDKPTIAAGYAPDQIARVKATCLYLATKLGDLMPELVVVGGLVPSLLIDQQNLPENVTLGADLQTDVVEFIRSFLEKMSP